MLQICHFGIGDKKKDRSTLLDPDDKSDVKSAEGVKVLVCLASRPRLALLLSPSEFAFTLFYGDRGGH